MDGVGEESERRGEARTTRKERRLTLRKTKTQRGRKRVREEGIRMTVTMGAVAEASKER